MYVLVYCLKNRFRNNRVNMMLALLLLMTIGCFPIDKDDDKDNNVSVISVDLSGTDFSGANLIGSNFSFYILSNCNFSSANLSNANLTGANMTGANLSNANLTDANLSNANLTDANMINVVLSNVNLSNVKHNNNYLGSFLNLHADNKDPYSMVYFNEFFYVLNYDSITTKVFKYSKNATYLDNVEITGNDATGIAYFSNSFYLTDAVTGEGSDIFEYTTNFTAVSSGNLDLQEISPNFIDLVYYDDSFYALNILSNKIFNYSTDGTYNVGDSFNLDVNNAQAASIEYYNEGFYITDIANSKVYKYSLDGTRDASGDFDLSTDANDDVRGITYFNHIFYTVDNSSSKILKYLAD